jgi:hypothetical protein
LYDDAAAVESLDPASLSSCEVRSCQELAALVDPAESDPLDDWLCAAISVFRVAGDICEPAPAPEAGAELGDVETGLAISNGSTALKPVDGFDDALDEDAPDDVSELTASSAVAAAPRANNMAKLRQLPHDAADLPLRWISKPRAMRKNPINQRLLANRTVAYPGN